MRDLDSIRPQPFPLKLSEKTLKIRWQVKIPDPEFLKNAGIQSIYTLLKLAQLRWTIHDARKRVNTKEGYLLQKVKRS